MKNKKALTEKIRKARELKTKVEKMSVELEALKNEIKGLMEIGDEIFVDDVKAMFFASERKNFQRKDFEKWWKKPIPDEFFKVTMVENLRID